MRTKWSRQLSEETCNSLGKFKMRRKRERRTRDLRMLVIRKWKRPCSKSLSKISSTLLVRTTNKLGWRLTKNFNRKEHWNLWRIKNKRRPQIKNLHLKPRHGPLKIQTTTISTIRWRLVCLDSRKETTSWTNLISRLLTKEPGRLTAKKIRSTTVKKSGKNDRNSKVKTNSWTLRTK